MNTKHTRVVVALLLAVASLATMGFRAPNDHRAASILADHVMCEAVEPSFRALEQPDLINDSCYADLVAMLENEMGWAFGSQASVEGLLDSIYASSSSTGNRAYPELLSIEIEMSRHVAPVEPSVKIVYPELLTSEIEMSRSIAPVELLDAETRQGLTSVPFNTMADPAEIVGERGSVGPSADLAARSRFSRVPVLSEADIAEMELDRGLGTASSPRALIESILSRSRSTGAWPGDLLELSETDANTQP